MSRIPRSIRKQPEPASPTSEDLSAAARSIPEGHMLFSYWQMPNATPSDPWYMGFVNNEGPVMAAEFTRDEILQLAARILTKAAHA